MKRCACGCGKKATHKHHVCYRQELRRVARSQGMDGWEKRYKGLVEDPRNLVGMQWRCHMEHHNRVAVIPCWRLPDEFYEFAREVLGAGPAYVYVSRVYAGIDPRLDALIEGEANEHAA